jgi:hypothetical protein
MNVTSTKDIVFPKLRFGIRAGEVKELPEDKDAQKRILAEPEISEVPVSKKGEQLKD